MNFDEMFKDFKLDGFTVFIQNTQSLENHSPEVRQMLAHLYDSKADKVKERLATIMNALFTQQLQTFMMSYRNLVYLYKEDGLSKFKNLGSKDYKLILAKMTNSDMFEVLRKPTAKKAGVYKLVNPTLVKLLSEMVAKDFLEAQEKYVLEFWENAESIAEDEKPLTPEEKKEFKRKLKEGMRKNLDELEKSRG